MARSFRRVLIVSAVIGVSLGCMSVAAWFAGQGQSVKAAQPNGQDSGGPPTGVFDCRYPAIGGEKSYDPKRFWGGFPKEFDAAHYKVPDWVLGPFTKSPANPVLGPTPGSWDRGQRVNGGGVHAAAVVVLDGKFCLVYRGERELDRKPGYIGDIGLATSDDGVHFTKDTEHSPFFGKGEDSKYSFEDVSLVRFKDTFYLFCNRWDWTRLNDPKVSGAFMATSKDLKHWTKHGLVFPQATETHRNPAILQNPENEPVKVNGKFVMYINNGLIAYSDDMLHWTSKKVAHPWPGGENCFALADWSKKYPNRILVFTGGNHSGHFYAIGEVLIDRNDPEKALEWLPRPVFCAETKYPWENGKAALPPHEHISDWRDTTWFAALTRYKGQWWMYYAGSEVYTCLATAPAEDSK